MRGLAAAAAAIDSRWVLLALLLALDLWAITLVIASDAARREKLLWTLVLLLCPIIGCLLWYVFGPKPLLVKRRKMKGRKRARRSG